MRAQQVLQITVGCVVVATPWLVARVALSVAASHARAVGTSLSTPTAVARLTRATAAVAPLVIAAAALLTPPSLLMAAIDLGAFTLLAWFGLQALGAIDAASRPVREVQAAERTASLRPRRLSDYLPLPVRLVPFIVTAAGVGVLGWRLGSVSLGRLLAPISFILAAPVFLWLYEVWMRQEISGDGSIRTDLQDAEAGRRTRVRQILFLEILLVTGLVSAGHALLGANWVQDGLRVALATVAGSILGVFGCAFALASDLSRRRFRQAGSKQL